LRFDALTKHLGAHIVSLRHRKGLTQAELARRSGISLKYVSMIESGTNPSLRTILKICHGLDANLADVVESCRKARIPEKKKRVTPLHVEIPHTCPVFQSLVRFIRKLDGEKRRRALDILRSL